MFSPGDVISYADMCAQEKRMLLAGMNYLCGGNYSVLLMSRRKGAPYEDTQDEDRSLIYEGHDWPKSHEHPYPKQEDQPLKNTSGSLTQNGKFREAAIRHKGGGEEPQRVRVYEKIIRGVWVYNGVFLLRDAWVEKRNGRNVFKFRLELVDIEVDSVPGRIRDTDIVHARLIPSHVKQEVWKRDKGMCQHPGCGAKDNLHFDHILPYSKGGTSLKSENIQLLCVRHNLKKHDRIE